VNIYTGDVVRFLGRGKPAEGHTGRVVGECAVGVKGEPAFVIRFADVADCTAYPDELELLEAAPLPKSGTQRRADRANLRAHLTGAQ